MAFKLSEIHKLPSDKQQKAVQVIVAKLKINPPNEFTFYAYWEFISEYQDAAKKVTTSSFHCGGYRNISKYREQKAQREADWEAVHLDGAVWAHRILDGETLPPSWSGESLQEAQRRLRSLGYKSSLEEELERERERANGWQGLDGDYW